VVPLDGLFWKHKSFVFYENEDVMPGLVANSVLGFHPNHPIMEAMLTWIEHNEISIKMTGNNAWVTVGPVLLTNIIKELRQNPEHGVTILESYYFYPVHHTGKTYTGHGKVYGHQVWGSTHNLYGKMSNVLVPPHLMAPKASISVCVINDIGGDTKELQQAHIRRFLQDIKAQVGHYNINIKWPRDLQHLDIITEFLETVRDITISTDMSPNKELFTMMLKISESVTPDTLAKYIRM
jgi:hypothetical protein